MVKKRETYETGRFTVLAAEEILGQDFPVLNHGFVRLVDYMGGDDAIVQAARVSYGRGTTKVSRDRELIRYLYRHRHTTPFEMVEAKFHAKMPIFVARQWIRHRTANVNEVSGRYSILDNEFYVPEPRVLGEQSRSNRQGRHGEIPSSEAADILRMIKEEALRDYSNYEYLLNEDPKNPGKGAPRNPERSMLARELARMGLGLNFYTQWYWKIDLHNLMHFLSLRLDKHAQYEIRQYADIMADMTRRIAPAAYEAFEDYRLNALNLSAVEIEIIGRTLRTGKDPRRIAQQKLKNKFERKEFMEKVDRLFRR